MELQLRRYNKYHCERNEEYVVCKDKLVSMWKNEIRDMTRTIVTDVFFPYSIMTQEELNSYNGIGKKFLNDISCNNVEIEKIICECLGCMLAPTNRFGKIFIWYGKGANGKSVLANVMQAIMGDLLTNANILKIDRNFTLSRTYKGIANITDDVGTSTLKETGLLKSIIDGSEIEIEKKFCDPISWKPNSQFVMCCNEIPHIADVSYGMIRRLAFIPFSMQLTKDQIDYDLLNKLKGTSILIKEEERNDNALRYIMTKAIMAYREAFKNNSLTELEEQKELLKDFEQENKDNISTFYDYLIEREGDLKKMCEYLNDKITEEIYEEYKRFLGEDPDVTNVAFKRRFNKLLPKNMIKVARKRIGNNILTYYYML